ncbi:hypothetical protein SLA2020_349540 [Shorea laevis]
MRRERNRITTLKINDSWVTNSTTLKTHIRDFFVDLFSRKETQATANDYSMFQPKLSDEDSASLLLPVSMEEIKTALFSMKGLKSPSPDGIQPIFYQKHWEVVSDTLHSFINKSFSDGFFEPTLLQAHITLILKGENPDVIQRFRPICLLNVAYKILSKVIVNRLRPHLQNLIGPIQSRLHERQWVPFRLSRGGLALSHLFFADDLMLFGAASTSQVQITMNYLAEFARRSRLELNLNKSKLFVSPNVQRHLANSYSSVCNIPLTMDLGTYLGVPIIHGKFKVATYKYILEKMQLKLAGWKQSFLSLAGRRTLVQSVTSSIPTYTMQTVLLPSNICSAIDSLNRKFLWGSDMNINKPHLVNWSDVCLPREHGGLGLRTARECNKALIAKLGWQLISGSKKPWCQAFNQKYLHSERFSSWKTTSSSSVTWRSILKCRDVLQLGIRWRVSSGMDIQLWSDIRAGSSTLLDSTMAPVPQ